MINAQGKVLLLVSGILLIVFGGISVLISFASLALPNGVIEFVLILICGILGILVGILGIMNRALPQKAQQCLIMDVILMGFIVVRSICTQILASETLNELTNSSPIVGGATVIGSIFGIILILIIPTLYLIGAIMNKKSFAQYQNNTQQYQNNTQQYQNNTQQYPQQQYQNNSQQQFPQQ